MTAQSESKLLLLKLYIMALYSCYHTEILIDEVNQNCFYIGQIGTSQTKCNLNVIHIYGGFQWSKISKCEKLFTIIIYHDFMLIKSWSHIL